MCVCVPTSLYNCAPACVLVCLTVCIPTPTYACRPTLLLMSLGESVTNTAEFGSLALIFPLSPCQHAQEIRMECKWHAVAVRCSVIVRGMDPDACLRRQTPSRGTSAMHPHPACHGTHAHESFMVRPCKHMRTHTRMRLNAINMYHSTCRTMHSTVAAV